MRRKAGGIIGTKAKLGVMWLTVFAVALSTGLPVAAAEVTNDRSEGVPAAVLPVQTDIGGEGLRRGDVAMVSNGGNPPPEPIAEHEGFVESDPLAELPIEHTAAKTGAKRSIKEGAADDVTKVQFAQFAVPRGTRPGTGPSQEEARKEMQLPSALKYQYAYGSDTEITYLKNPDLNSRVRDDSVILAPNFFGIITYRPNAWLETTLEMTLERLIALKEEEVVTLPDGTIQYAEKKRLSLMVDQAYVTFKDLGPFDVTLGRRNFEDTHLWLYDVALDGLIVKHRHGDFHTEASVTREDGFDGELLFYVPRGKINNYMLYTEYRGIEDHKLAAYAFKRDDRSGQEGKPLHLGVSAYGRPTDRFNYWTELAFSRGKDELKHNLQGYGFDVRGTYRFPDLSLQPSITLGYAFGSGDDNPNDNTNHEFWQTGLQSNEGRFGGLTQFMYYGETLDPELTNLKILTVGVGFRLAPNAFLDLVCHRYRLDKMVRGELRSSALTALMNQDDTHLSKDVGSEIDIILGFRNLFGLRRFGFEMRAGWFRPGKAYRIPVGDPDDPTYRKADDAFSVLAVFIF